jgi:hypothetical protein
LLSAPTTGLTGGNGDRIVLRSGNVGSFPCSFGMNGGTLWYSTPPNAIHNFYVSGSSAFQVGFSGATLRGVLNVSGNTTF